MSGPAHPVFVLVRPQMGENIGAAARGMWNFGLPAMRLVAPRDGWRNPAAVAMASGAGRVLDAARVIPTTAEAVADCTYVYATTARPRVLVKPVLGPDEAMAEAAGRIAAGERVAFLFGPERTGMENDDIAQANAIVTLPVNPAFPSLNLAQCVNVLAYDWARASGAGKPEPVVRHEPANQAEIDALTRHYEQRLEEAGFFFPPEKAEGMKLNLRNLWSRMDLNRADVQMLHGMLRQMVRWADKGGRAHQPQDAED